MIAERVEAETKRQMDVLGNSRPQSVAGVTPSSFNLRPQPLSPAVKRFVKFAEAGDQEAIRVLDAEVPDWRARAALGKKEGG